MVSKKKVKKLKHLLVKGIYYKLLNTSYIFTYNAWIYCKCYQFQGCRPEDCERSYCFICRVRVSYHSGRIENLKKLQILLIITLKLKMIFNYVVILTHYVKTFGFIITIASWRNRFVICKWKYLKDYIVTFDIFRKILIEDS